MGNLMSVTSATNRTYKLSKREMRWIRNYLLWTGRDVDHYTPSMLVTELERTVRNGVNEFLLQCRMFGYEGVR